MRTWIDNAGCGAAGYVDVFNMTSDIIKNHYGAAESLRFDNAHWGLQVNLIKAQLLVRSVTANGFPSDPLSS